MLAGMRAVTLIRYDEIGLKGRNRRFFEDRLRENVARALGLPPRSVARERGRLFAWRPDEAPSAARDRALARVFGIRSFSPALVVAAELPAISEAVFGIADAGVARGVAAFAMDCRRSTKAFPFTSLELNVRLGRAVQDRHPGLRVDLESPDLTIHVEVREAGAYVYDAVVPGPGGLPVGVSGRALLLLSGGIDSPVAGWMAMKRGLDLDSVHFHTPPYTAPQAREKAIAIARELAAWGGRPARIHLVPVTALQQAIGRAVSERLWTLSLRRAMVRLAERIARRAGQSALVIGDSLGQVASQTLENITVVDGVVEIPILRPLIGFDKAEIVGLARRIGTFELSVQPFEDCCVLFAPRHPATRARLDALATAERDLPLEDLLAAALDEAETVQLGAGECLAPQPSPAGICEAALASGVSRTRAIRIPSSSSTVNR
jgi:thiamine biosynthesis protein ThiI